MWVRWFDVIARNEVLDPCRVIVNKRDKRNYDKDQAKRCKTTTTII